MNKIRKITKRVFALALVMMMVLSYAPMTFAADSMSAEFKAILNEEGKFEMYTAIPETEEEKNLFFFDSVYMYENYPYPDWKFEEFSDDFKSCVITYGETGEAHKVEIEYIYDEATDAGISDLLDKLYKGVYNEEYDCYDPYCVEAKDMELVNFWVNGGDINDLIAYSKEFKELIGYSNFTVNIDYRAGSNSMFSTSAEGFASFVNGGSIYGMPSLSVNADHIIYVPDDTGDTAEELQAAAMKRIEEYVGKGKVEMLGYEQGILEFLLSSDNYRIAEAEELVEFWESEIADTEALIAAEEALREEYTAAYEEAVAGYNEWDTLITEANAAQAIEQEDYDNLQIYRDELVVAIEAKQAEMEATDDPDVIATLDAEIYEMDSQLPGIDEEMNALAESMAERSELIMQYENERSAYEPEQYVDLLAQVEDNLLNYDTTLSETNSQLFWAEQDLMWAENSKEYTLSSYNDEDGANYFLQQAEGDYFFAVAVTIGDATTMYHFVVMKDSDKMIAPESKTADVKTGITIETTDASVPLDTVVNVEEVTSGKVYENIMSVLTEVKESKTFDINLYSDSLGENITKLTGGKFKVRIPIDAEFKGKDLIVYYIDENLKVHEHEVEVDGEFAAFETDHFSVYTLAVVETEEASGGDIGEDTTDSTVTPDTGDANNIWLLCAVMMMSVIAGCYAGMKKRAQE